jgi:hypothetical protein
MLMLLWFLWARKRYVAPTVSFYVSTSVPWADGTSRKRKYKLSSTKGQIPARSWTIAIRKASSDGESLVFRVEPSMQWPAAHDSANEWIETTSITTC